MVALNLKRGESVTITLLIRYCRREKVITSLLTLYKIVADLLKLIPVHQLTKCLQSSQCTVDTLGLENSTFRIQTV